MEKLELVRENLMSALTKLSESLRYFENLKSIVNEQASILMSNEELKKSLRDSLIQRFEFCADLFWKYLKKYEEIILGLSLDVNAPRPVIVAACKSKIVSEIDAEILLELMRSRNFTSHIYKEEMADHISTKIPIYYKTMKKYVELLK